MLFLYFYELLKKINKNKLTATFRSFRLMDRKKQITHMFHVYSYFCHYPNLIFMQFLVIVSGSKIFLSDCGAGSQNIVLHKRWEWNFLYFYLILFIYIIFFQESIDEAEKRKKKLRTYEEIKENFDALNIKIETDVEILTKLMNRYENAKTDEDRASLLEDMEYLVHQFDNAITFVEMGKCSDF